MYFCYLFKLQFHTYIRLQNQSVGVLFEVSHKQEDHTWEWIALVFVVVLDQDALLLICIRPCWLRLKKLEDQLPFVFYGLLHFMQYVNVSKQLEMAVKLFWCEKIWPLILQLSDRRGWAGIDSFSL